MDCTSETKFYWPRYFIKLDLIRTIIRKINPFWTTKVVLYWIEVCCTYDQLTMLV